MEVIQRAGSPRGELRRIIGVLVALALVCWLMLALIFGIIVGKGAPIIAAVLSVAVTWALYRFKVRQLTAVWEGTRMELTPVGVRVVEPYLCQELRWENIVRIGPATTMAALRAAGTKQARTAYQAVNAAMIQNVEALIGRGDTIINPNAPMIMKKQFEQNRLTEHETHISLTLFEPGWRQGRIGAWIRAYRPDLMA